MVDIYRPTIIKLMLICHQDVSLPEANTLFTNGTSHGTTSSAQCPVPGERKTTSSPLTVPGRGGFPEPEVFCI